MPAGHISDARKQEYATVYSIAIDYSPIDRMQVALSGLTTFGHRLPNPQGFAILYYAVLMANKRSRKELKIQNDRSLKEMFEGQHAGMCGTKRLRVANSDSPPWKQM
jgi:hypothetical protein